MEITRGLQGDGGGLKNRKAYQKPLSYYDERGGKIYWIGVIRPSWNLIIYE